MSESRGMNNRRSKNNSKFAFRKRNVSKPAFEKVDIFVNNQSNFKANLQKIRKLWIEGEKVIVVRALGAAIPRAINLCLQLKEEHFNSIELEVNTSTVTLVDDLEPLVDDEDFETSTRRSSSICVKIIRKGDS